MWSRLTPRPLVSVLLGIHLTHPSAFLARASHGNVSCTIRDLSPSTLRFLLCFCPARPVLPRVVVPTGLQREALPSLLVGLRWNSLNDFSEPHLAHRFMSPATLRGL